MSDKQTLSNVTPESEAIVELETKVAFMEKHINELSDAICQQQKQLDLLNTKYTRLKDYLENKENELPTESDDPALEKPPHY